MANEASIFAGRQTSIALDLQNSAARFALQTALSAFSDVVVLDSFSVSERKLILNERPANLLITDLFNCEIHNRTFASNCLDNDKPNLIAYIPTYIATQCFFRLQQAGIPICLWRNGIDPVVKTVERYLTGNESPPELTMDDGSLTYLTYGTKNLSSKIEDIPEPLRRYLPRLSFAPVKFDFEFDSPHSQSTAMIQKVCDYFQVSNKDEAIAKIQRTLGIQQFSDQQDPVDLKLLEENALAIIAKWLNEKKAS